MTSKSFISAVAVCVALMGATAGAEAKDSNRKSALLGAAGGVAAGVAGTLLYQKMKSPSTETTGSVRPARSLKEDDDEDDRPVRRRGVDQTSTGSVHRASQSESCSVKQIDLFDRKGNFVKAERMRVCQ